MTTARLMYQVEAAAYLRMPIKTFKQQCPVKPISFDGRKGIFYDKADLDAWIERLKCGLDKSPSNEWDEVWK